jgi:hypothetical protein
VSVQARWASVGWWAWVEGCARSGMQAPPRCSPLLPLHLRCPLLLPLHMQPPGSPARGGGAHQHRNNVRQMAAGAGRPLSQPSGPASAALPPIPLHLLLPALYASSSTLPSTLPLCTVSPAARSSLLIASSSPPACSALSLLLSALLRYLAFILRCNDSTTQRREPQRSAAAAATLARRSVLRHRRTLLRRRLAPPYCAAASATSCRNIAQYPNRHVACWQASLEQGDTWLPCTVAAASRSRWRSRGPCTPCGRSAIPPPVHACWPPPPRRAALLAAGRGTTALLKSGGMIVPTTRRAAALQPLVSTALPPARLPVPP